MIETIQYDNLKWLNITDSTVEDYNILLNQYHFHPLDIEDCRGTTQRPKVDEYDNYYFLILHFPYFDKDNKSIHVCEVKIFWGCNYIITVGKNHWVVKKFFEEVKEKLGKEDKEMVDMSTSDQLLYHILSRLMIETNILIQRIGSEVDRINKEIFNHHNREIIEKISITRRNIIILNTTFRPQLHVLRMFESGGIKGFADPDYINMEDYWGNILDQYQKMYDLVEDFGELIEGLSQTFDSLLTNRTNQIMRILTYFSTIILPLTLITGFFGMNIEFPFCPNIKAFWCILGFLGILTLSIVLLFRHIDR